MSPVSNLTWDSTTVARLPQSATTGGSRSASEPKTIFGAHVHKPSRREKKPDTGETSSWRLPISQEQHDLFKEVLSVFEQTGIKYAVAGAYALNAHTGICRDTKDLDVFLTAQHAELALRCLGERGFACEICDPVWLYKVHRNGYFVDLITGMSNAVLTVQDAWIERSCPAMVEGVQSRVLAAEELLASKLFVVRRERFDGADIAHVIYGTRGNLDWGRILELAGESWEMLYWALILFHFVYPAQSDYVPRRVWDRLTARFQDSISHPDPGAKFRGSLVDEKMFAIDVKDWGLDNLLLDFRRRRLETVTAQE